MGLGGMGLGAAPINAAGGPGFWTGMAGGSVLGWMLGNRNRGYNHGYGYNQGYGYNNAGYGGFGARAYRLATALRADINASADFYLCVLACLQCGRRLCGASGSRFALFAALIKKIYSASAELTCARCVLPCAASAASSGSRTASGYGGTRRR